MLIKTKNRLSQLFCKHDYQKFKRPIDIRTNPNGFVALNDDGILVCTKCGKGI